MYCQAWGKGVGSESATKVYALGQRTDALTNEPNQRGHIKAILKLSLKLEVGNSKCARH